MNQDKIVIKGAREHNLKNISLEIIMTAVIISIASQGGDLFFSFLKRKILTQVQYFFFLDLNLTAHAFL